MIPCTIAADIFRVVIVLLGSFYGYFGSWSRISNLQSLLARAHFGPKLTAVPQSAADPPPAHHGHSQGSQRLGMSLEANGLTINLGD